MPQHKYLTILGITLEAAAVGILFQTQTPPLPRVCLFLATHALASLASAGALWVILPRRYRYPRGKTFALFAVFSFFTPILGIIGLAAGNLFFLRFGREQSTSGIVSIATPTFMPEARVHLSQFGEGGVRARLANTGIPRQLRVQALLAMESMGGHSSNNVIRLATQDDDDEVRLLAFGMLDARENRINLRIHEQLALLGEPDRSAGELAEANRQLALLYWELIYQELVRDNLRDYAMERALVHAREAARALPEDQGLQVLLGRMHLYRGEHSLALAAFAQARALGAPESRVLPYLAELAFLKGDYSEVRRLLASEPSFASIPMLAPVVSLWRETP